VAIKPNKYVSDLAPYKIASQEVWTKGSDRNDLLKVDWNEAPRDHWFYKEEIKRICDEWGVLSWYPDYSAVALINELSRFLGLPTDYIRAFPGSDTAMETICRTFLSPGDQVVALCPTYENFFVFAQQMGCQLIKQILEPPFTLGVGQLGELLDVKNETKLVYLASPNNPCGYYIERPALETLAKSFPDTLILVDEAYIEFADYESAVGLTALFPNLVVVRTFSKAFGLAGMRLGYVCASPGLLASLDKIRNGKNLPMISQMMGVFALQNFEKVEDWIKEVRSARTFLELWLAQRNIVFFPSHGNYILCIAKHPADLCKSLAREGVYVRDRTQVLEGAVRFTIGSLADTRRLTRLLDSLYDLLV